MEIKWITNRLPTGEYMKDKDFKRYTNYQENNTSDMRRSNSMMKYIVLLFVGLLNGINGHTQTTALNAADYQVAAQDGAWCWFADPRAVYHKGKQEKIYYGYINSQGDVVISSRDMKTKV